MFRKASPPTGARPGTLAIPDGSPPPTMRVLSYSPRGLREVAVQDPRDLVRCLDGDETTWIDVQGLGDEALLRRLAEVFRLHPLALEAAVNVPQRAASILYEHHQVVIARMPLLQEDGRVDVPQVCLIVGRRYLLTVQERPFGFFDPVRERLRAGIGPIWALGPDYLTYALIDTLVDGYYPIAERLAQGLDDLEDAVVARPEPDMLAEVHRIRRQLVVLRRVGWPQREAIGTLLREQTPFVTDQVRTFFRDTYAHMAQIMELIDSARDTAVGLSEVYLSTVSHRTNEIMKVLTLMASIFIPLTPTSSFWAP